MNVDYLAGSASRHIVDLGPSVVVSERTAACMAAYDRSDVYRQLGWSVNSGALSPIRLWLLTQWLREGVAVHCRCGRKAGT